MTSPPAPQNYGMVCSGSPATFRNFTFTVDPALGCGNTVTASLAVTDGAINYGTFTYSFVTGNLASPTTIQNFDGVVAPALPAGWTTYVFRYRNRCDDLNHISRHGPQRCVSLRGDQHGSF